ncbi:MAG TPA: acyltransferase [Abditibacteriaceae bacterium]|jgi:acetyltransferase-like isoleucine patch superfamily enzyme
MSKPIGVWRNFAFARMKESTVEKRLFLPASNKYKCDLLRWGGASIGDDVRFHFPVSFLNFAGKGRERFKNLSIGDNVFIGHNVQFDLKEEIRIAGDVTISANAVFLTHSEVGTIPLAAHYPPLRAPIEIEGNVYLGANVVILPGVRIETGSVVAAGAVVTKNVAANTVVAGVPARVVKTL